MMGEVEVKSSIEDRQALVKRVQEIGGVFVREVAQEDVYFTHPCRDLKERDEALRLRREGSETILTFKGKKAGGMAKVREELEVGVASFKEASAILKRLGFVEGLVVRKRRAVYVVGDVEVSLDSVEGLGEFVEVEAKAAAAGIDTEEGLQLLDCAKSKVFDVADRLGLQRDRLSTASYLELLESASSSSSALR